MEGVRCVCVCHSKNAEIRFRRRRVVCVCVCVCVFCSGCSTCAYRRLVASSSRGAADAEAPNDSTEGAAETELNVLKSRDRGVFSMSSTVFT